MIVDSALYVEGRRMEGRLALEHVPAACLRPDSFVWLGLYEPTEEEFEAVRMALAGGGVSEPSPPESGGDPVCWLHLACPECGAIPDPGEENLDRCPRCGAERTPSEGPPAGS